VCRKYSKGVSQGVILIGSAWVTPTSGAGNCRRNFQASKLSPRFCVRVIFHLHHSFSREWPRGWTASLAERRRKFPEAVGSFLSLPGVALFVLDKMADPKDVPCFSPGDSADEYRNRVQEWASFIQVAAEHNPKVHGLIKANLAEYLIQGLAPPYRATIRKLQRDGSLPITNKPLEDAAKVVDFVTKEPDATRHARYLDSFTTAINYKRKQTEAILTFARAYEGKANALLSLFANQSRASAEVLEQLLAIQLLENAQLGESLGAARLELMKRSQVQSDSPTFATQAKGLKERIEGLSTLSASLAESVASNTSITGETFGGLRKLANDLQSGIQSLLETELPLLTSSTLSGSSTVRPLPLKTESMEGVQVTLSIAVSVLQMVDEQGPGNLSRKRKADQDFASVANTVTQRVTSALLAQHKKPGIPMDRNLSHNNSSVPSHSGVIVSAPGVPAATQSKKSRRSDMSSVTCWACGVKGHKRGNAVCVEQRSKN
jgi:hypothetical protein